MKKVIMVILDGFGISNNDVNVIKDMDCFNQLYLDYPHSELKAGGESIGLPDDQYGDSKVGHLTIGAGKKVKQDITLCNEVLGSTLIEHNEKLIALINNTKIKGGALHLMGLVSDGGIHSDITYMKNFLHHLKEIGVDSVKFHAITDGRDNIDQNAKEFISDIQNTLKELKLGKVVTVCGRYYAMDKEENWDRTKVYTDLLLNGKGVSIKSIEKGIDACYARDLKDEFIVPIVLDEDATIKDNDSLIWLNFRSDRAVQLLSALTLEDFDSYRIKKLKNFDVVSILPIEGLKNIDYLIEGKEEIYSIGTYLSELGLKQARIAETESFMYATYYFNGAEKTKLKGCDNFLIDSIDCESYEKYPEMRAREITKQTIKCIEKDYDFIVADFANPDLLGHTGNIEACKIGLEVIDECLKKIVEAVDDNFYKLIITSDHGNIEEMLDKDGEANMEHSMNPVPFIIRDKHVNLRHKGDITQIAPTILKYMDIAIPKQMKGTRTLFNEED